MKVLYDKSDFTKYFIQKIFVILAILIILVLLPVLLVQKHLSLLLVVFVLAASIGTAFFMTLNLNQKCRKNEDALLEVVNRCNVAETIEEDGLLGISYFPPICVSERFIFHNYHDRKAMYLPFRSIIKREHICLIYLRDISFNSDGELEYINKAVAEILYLGYDGIQHVYVPIPYRSSSNQRAFLEEMVDVGNTLDIPVVCDTDYEDDARILDVFQRHDREEINAWIAYMKEHGE